MIEILAIENQADAEFVLRGGEGACVPVSVAYPIPMMKGVGNEVDTQRLSSRLLEIQRARKAAIVTDGTLTRQESLAAGHFIQNAMGQATTAAEFLGVLQGEIRQQIVENIMLSQAAVAIVDWDKQHYPLREGLGFIQLYADVRSGNQVMDGKGPAIETTIQIDGQELSLSEIDTDIPVEHLFNIFDLAHNAVRAGATRVDINVQTLANGMTVVVSDNGSGISSKDLRNIFSPEFTTNGGGMGLYLLDQYVARLQGTICVTSGGQEYERSFTSGALRESGNTGIKLDEPYNTRFEVFIAKFQ